MNFMDDAAVAIAACGPDAALYGLSAARVHALTLDDPPLIDVVVPWLPRGGFDIPGVRVRRTRGTGRLPVVPSPLPHTHIVDTVLDLGDRTDGETCVFWLTEATRRGLVTVDEVLDGLLGRRRHRHRAIIVDIAADVASGATSNLEVRYVRGVERAHGLPQAERQLIVPETGHRDDFAYPFARLLIEVDGLTYHQGAQVERDRALDALHAAAGWTTIRYTWGQVVGSPCALAREVARLLTQAGMPINARPCAAERDAA